MSLKSTKYKPQETANRNRWAHDVSTCKRRINDYFVYRSVSTILHLAGRKMLSLFLSAASSLATSS